MFPVGMPGVGGVPWNFGPGYNISSTLGASGMLAQESGWYKKCVSYNFNCDKDGNYVPPDGSEVITVNCGGTFAEIDCDPPPEAVAGSQGISILTSNGMRYNLGLLAAYQGDPMSSFGKDVLRRLDAIADEAQQFIILNYAGSALGGAAGAFAGNLGLMKVAGGSFEGNIHFAFGVNGAWMHGIDTGGEVIATRGLASGFAANAIRIPWPVLYPEAVLPEAGSSMTNCFTGMCSAIARGWGF